MKNIILVLFTFVFLVAINKETQQLVFCNDAADNIEVLPIIIDKVEIVIPWTKDIKEDDDESIWRAVRLLPDKTLCVEVKYIKEEEEDVIKIVGE